uniref:Uncharacterized protein n=3 Tax=Emiliania huxleyi TaxID=2903 RepID=A0A7S3SFH4_EMIHU|mmetsp:Transcript_13236/g.38723  ORF Transcript_13236/g.38723 Transcript_13236/m.38723 type:complete len:444 (+) Transcript_13236:3-1334(+)
MLDSVVAERTHSQPQLATELQSLVLGFAGVVKVAAATFKGALLRAAGTRSLFGVALACSLGLLPGAAWLGERRLPAGEDRCTLGQACCSNAASGAPIFRLAQFLSLVGAASACGIFLIDDVWWGPPAVAAPAVLLICAACWHYEGHVSPTLARASIFTFLSGALQPQLIVLFKFYKETDDNCSPAEPIPGLHPLPCFSSEFVGMLDLGAEIAFLLGLVVYAEVFSGLSYRSIYYALQSLLVVVNLLDLFWVSRLNLAAGLPDALFALGAELMQPLIDDMLRIPLFALIARESPRECAGTTFAINMGLIWLGRNIGGFFGMGLLAALGGVEPPAFENIRVLVLVRSLTRALPLLLIPHLLPPGAPTDAGPATPSVSLAASDIALAETGRERRGDVDDGAGACSAGEGGGGNGASSDPSRGGVEDGSQGGYDMRPLAVPASENKE